MNLPDETVALTNEKWVEQFSRFLQKIGIKTRETVLGMHTFLPGVEIIHGELLYDPEKLLYPGDLLHEAGHIALTPASQRPQLNGNVTDTDPLREGDEMAVMLWTYAVALDMDIPLEIVFHEYGYKDQSDWLMKNYTCGNYIGLPLLKWMGLTDDRFPLMQRWLRE